MLSASSYFCLALVLTDSVPVAAADLGGRPAFVGKAAPYQDRGFISVDTARKLFVLRQFHVEGFVNTYTAAPEGPPIVFTSEAIENIPTGWRARETWRLEPGGELVEVFELAEPGKEFTTYSETRLRRVAK